MLYSLFHSFSGVKRVLLQTAMVGTLSIAGVVAGLDGAANAQSTPDPAKIRGYAASVLAIEPLRREAFQEIQQILGSGAAMPNIACHQPNSLNGLRREVRQVAVEYCNQSIQVVEQNGLSITEFNSITAAQRSNRNLAERIRQELRRLQGGNR